MSKSATVSFEEALKIFSNWKDKLVKVRVDFWLGDKIEIRGSLSGFVIAVEPPTMAGLISMQESFEPNNEGARLEVDLRGCAFSRSKSVDPPMYGGRPELALMYEDVLSVKFPSGDMLVFMGFTRGN